MKRTTVRLLVIALLALAVSAFAQEKANSYRGFNEYENFRGLVNSSGALLGIDSSLGYDFNRNFGIFGGVPMYFTHSPDSAGSGNLQAAGMGDAYVGAEFFAYNRVLKYSSTVTVGLPTGDVAKGFSPGETTVYWTNRVRHSFGRLTPSFTVGVGNSLGIMIGAPGSQPITGSLTSTDTIAQTQECAEFDLTRRAYLGGAGYQIFPFNQQADANVAGSQVRENGFETWVGFEPSRIVRMEVGYARSMTFGLNSMTVHMGLNVGRFMRSVRSSRGPAKPIRG